MPVTGVNAEGGQKKHPIDQVEQPVVQGKTYGGAALRFTCGLHRPDAAYETIRGEPVKIDDAVHIVVTDHHALTPVDPQQIGDIPLLQHGQYDGYQIGGQ
jgi:hypothetical protein